MDTLLLYIIQANASLVLLALIYRYLLAHDTLFSVRRIFWLIAILISFTYQFMPALVDIEFHRSAVETTTFNPQLNLDTSKISVVNESQSYSLISILNMLWLTGCALLAIRLMVGFIVIMRIKAKGKPTIINGNKVFVIDKELTPFSFVRWIFISSSYLKNISLQDIIIHEKAHVKGVHSFDVIISELLAVIFWFNPAVWFIRYAIRENLEFLADKNVLDCGHNRKEYQYNLLRLSYQPSVNNIVNYFNVSQLKNRIIMMNRKKTSQKAILKYALLLPALMLLSLTNNAQTKEKNDAQKILLRMSDVEKKPLIIVDGKEVEFGAFEKIDPKTVKSISVLKDSTSVLVYGDKGKNGVVLVETKDDVKAKGANSKQKDEVNLDEVTVVGFGTMKKDSTLQVIGYRSNVKSADKKSSPMIILNDKQITKEELDKLDPNTIESVAVLKDKSATNVYGEKGKNGVVIVKLKK
ncbi:MAG: M56 family metallopeptidase [Rikenellaceae bacterium]